MSYPVSQINFRWHRHRRNSLGVFNRFLQSIQANEQLAVGQVQESPAETPACFEQFAEGGGNVAVGAPRPRSKARAQPASPNRFPTHLERVSWTGWSGSTGCLRARRKKPSAVSGSPMSLSVLASRLRLARSARRPRAAWQTEMNNSSPAGASTPVSLNHPFAVQPRAALRSAASAWRAFGGCDGRAFGRPRDARHLRAACGLRTHSPQMAARRPTRPRPRSDP